MQKLFIISNESIYENNSKYFCDNLDLKSTPEGLNKTFFSAFENIENKKFGVHEAKLMGSRIKIVGEDKKLLDDFILNNYFSSKCVIDALSRRDKLSCKEIDVKIYMSKLKHQLKT